MNKKQYILYWHKEELMKKKIFKYLFSLGLILTVSSSIKYAQTNASTVSTKFSSIEVGRFHSSAITLDGKVYTWGQNDYGQLGNDTTTNQFTPVEITSRFSLSSGDKILQMALGSYFSGAISAEGKVFTWGQNTNGQLGLTTAGVAIHRIPVNITDKFPLALNDKIIALELSNNYSAAVSQEGRVFTWGQNTYGQLGNGNLNDVHSPFEITDKFTDLALNDKITKVQLNNASSVAVSKEGKVFTWGNNIIGQLGIGNVVNQSLPQNITNQFGLTLPDKITNVSMGVQHTGAVSQNGEVFIWGRNVEGQLGTGDNVGQNAPINITNEFDSLTSGDKIINLFLGGSSSTVLSQEGKVFSFGGNSAGLLGDGTLTSGNEPQEITDNFVELSAGEKIVKLALFYQHGSALSSEGKIFTWGSNIAGQLGHGHTTTLALPTQLILLQDMKAAAINEVETAFVTYTESDYSETKWSELVAAKNTAITAINNAISNEVVLSAKNTGLSAMAAIKTMIDELADARTAAINAINSAYDTYDIADYAPDKWLEIVEAKNVALTTINAVTTIEEVNNAKVNGVLAMSEIKTLAEELADAKAAAIIEINNEYGTYVETDYDSEEWIELVAAKEGAITAINDAALVTEVLSSKETGIATMEAVKTSLEKLAAAKVAATNEINTIFSSYVETNYASDKWMQLVEAKEAALTAINSGTTIATVTEVKEIGINEMAAIDSLAKQLDDEKISAILAINSAFLTYNEADYAPDKWSELVNTKNAAIAEINSATSTSDVNNHKEAGVSAMERVQTLAEELADAKTTALAEINGIFATYNEADYNPEKWAELVAARQAAIEEINSASIINEVNSARLNGINVMAQVKILAESGTKANLLWLWILLAIILTAGLIVLVYFLIILLKKKRRIVVVPVEEEPFSLTRADILKHVEDMNGDHKTYPQKVEVKEKKNEAFPDTLYVNGKNFALVYEYKGVTKVVLRLEKEYGSKLMETYKHVKTSFLKGGEFFEVIITKELASAKRVYEIIDYAYFYTKSLSEKLQ